MPPLAKQKYKILHHVMRQVECHSGDVKERLFRLSLSHETPLSAFWGDKATRRI